MIICKKVHLFMWNFCYSTNWKNQKYLKLLWTYNL